MPSTFIPKTKAEVTQCAKAINCFAQDFGISAYRSELFSLAVSEAAINSLRYANGASVKLDYTSNKKGIEVRIEDHGKGILNLESFMQDGKSTVSNSLGMGLGAIKRSVDNMIIEKNDATGFCLLLQVFINTHDYESACVSVKKDGEDFNGDSCIIHHYDGDSSIYAVIDGAGSGFKAYKSALFVHDVILENISLGLVEILELCHIQLKDSSEYSRAVEIAIVRLQGDSLEYIILGNLNIKSYPKYSFFSHSGSLGLSLPTALHVRKQRLEENFCLSMSSDGIESIFTLYNLYETYSAESLAKNIFNSYNIDDDSSIIVIKR